MSTLLHVAIGLLVVVVPSCRNSPKTAQNQRGCTRTHSQVPWSLPMSRNRNRSPAAVGAPAAAEPLMPAADVVSVVPGLWGGDTVRMLGLAKRGSRYDVVEASVPADALRVRLPRLDRPKALEQLKLAQQQLYAMGREPLWPASIRGDMLAAQSCLAQLWPLVEGLSAIIEACAKPDATDVHHAELERLLGTIAKQRADLAPLYAKAMGDA